MHTLGAGRYVLHSPIARGGMATVFRAEDTRLGVQRAIKVLAPKSAPHRDSELMARFDREARIMAALDHPHVVPVHDVGEDDDHMWFVMTLYEGGTVAELLERSGPLPPERACAIVSAVLEALAAAHERGIIHRDVKPSNVLLDGEGRPRLADFGIARVEAADGPTSTGAIIGTWSYMAPEQRVNSKGVDARTDVYGVGALLAQLLTQRDPVDLHNPASHPELLQGMPARLRAFVIRCTRYHPEERFDDAIQASAALAACTAPPPQPAASPGAIAFFGIGTVGVGVLGVFGGVSVSVLLVLVAAQQGTFDRGAPKEVPVQAIAAPEPEVAPIVDDVPMVEAPPVGEVTLVVPKPAAPIIRAAPPEPRPSDAPLSKVRVAVSNGSFALQIDGVTRGPTPWDGWLAAGSHRLVILDGGGTVVHEEVWDTGANPRRCLVPDTWVPCPF